MKLHLTSVCACVLATAIGFTSVASAKSIVDNPKDRADRGIGCLVQSGSFDYVVDPNCTANFVRKFDKDGNYIGYRYRDEGNLQPGQTAPDRALRIPFDDGTCKGHEVISPSGRYSSVVNCNF